MRYRQQVPAALRRLLMAQDGVVSREQILGCGLSRHTLDRLVTSGDWLRLARGIYLNAREPTWISYAWAGVLLGGDKARLGGEAAAYLHGLVDQPPPTILILVPWEAGTPAAGEPWTFVRERVGVRDRRSIGGPPRTTIDDTVLDLVNRAAQPGRVIGLVSTAVQRRLTTPQRLAKAASARGHLKHRRLVSDLLGDVATGAESPLELAYLRDVERAHALPTARRQARRGRTKVDALYEEYGVAVELDGRLGHEGEGRFRDMTRDNAATSAGLATLRYGHADVLGQPCLVAAEVARTLRLRGWCGAPAPCSRCRAVA